MSHAKRTKVRRAAGLWGLALLMGASMGLPARADELPPPLEAKLLLSILPYDQSLPPGDPLRVAVLYAPGNSESERVADQIVSTVAKSGDRPLKDRGVKAVKLAIGSGADGLETLKAGGYGVALIAPGLLDRAGAIAQATRQSGILTVGGSAQYTRSGVVLGLASEDDEPKIYVNAEAARQTGITFPSGFLSLAESVQ
jgi:hypothetical protein